MPELTYSFKRYEIKYLLTPAQFEEIKRTLIPSLSPDRFGKSTVLSLYLDTPDYRMIRASIEAVNFKEKLRIRSYGNPGPDSRLFLEVKRKYNSETYKRRLALSREQLEGYMNNRTWPEDSQIMRELDYTFWRYNYPKPACLIACERTAFFFPESSELRLTFDENIRARVKKPTLYEGDGGIPLLPDGQVLMEFKTDGRMPAELAGALEAIGIRRSSMSKYGTAYTGLILPEMHHEIKSTGALSNAFSL